MEIIGQRTRMVALLLLLVAAAHAQQVGPTGNTCPDSCTDSSQPVCGTNGVLYRNLCELRRASCVNSNIRKRNDGPCVAPETRGCDRDCDDGYQPICATNGKTYDNRCELSIATCRNSNIKTRYEGVCPVPPSSSSGASSVPVAQPAVVRPSNNLNPAISSSSSGNPRPSILDMIGAPVRPFLPASRPTQNNPSPSSSPAVAVVNTPRPVRNCPDNCNPGFRPVCGTDGQVYGSECKIRVAICKNPNLGKKNDGVCQKDCSIQCPTDINFVCGTNGKTYVNECELTVARCKDPSIRKASNGQCRPSVTRDPQCNVGDCGNTIAPVCGSDGVTYRNNCELRRQGCVNTSLLRLHDGECSVQQCGNTCRAVLEPVCGSDGKVYRNHCELINTACKQRSSLQRVANERCIRRN